MFVFGKPRFFFEGDTEGGNPPAAAAPAAAATLSPEVLAQLAASSEAAVKTAVSKANAEAEERYQAAIKQQNNKIIKALKGDGDSDPDDVNARVLQKFIETPADVLSHIARTVSERTRGEVLDEISSRNERIREQNHALSEVLKGRPDIRGNRVAMEQLDVIFSLETDEKLDDKARFNQAIATFDRRVEAVGAPKAEDRIKAASMPTQVVSSGGNAGKDSAEGHENRQAAALKAERDERIERYKRTHGGNRPPASIRR